MNILICYAITLGKYSAKFNPPNERPFDCSSGSRQHNNDGREQSGQIGQQINELNIQIGEVYSSGFFRCDETAKLAFGRFTTINWLSARPGVFNLDVDRVLRLIPSHGLLNKIPLGKNNVYIEYGDTFTQGLLS